MLLFSLADRLNMIPSELARRITRTEIVEILAWERIKKRRGEEGDG